ncbi:hypothetical protein NLX83_33450 [Allokutzneria sp. A3M-2-11 16]|uniref:hypothetical protein n=1 Tax=Allokutzneria sp. A3M-2-11 16 TaxID=2962043 RepID=UPI0020B6EFEA|nr:hypothetical protein [Allokutzneria sp. A3M-2-11 16]MCP3804190.1 hypothetical protein [Allokutzneria sp. A3M-2-11 16]
MPGFLFHQNNKVTCPHAGEVKVNSPGQARVMVSGLLVAGAGFQNEVIGCSLPQGPCVKVKWANLATRVKVSGQPVVLYEPAAGVGNGATESSSPGPPQGAGVQPRVRGL